MLDLYMRADDEAALKSALPWAVTQKGEWVIATPSYALDLIGPLEIVPAVSDLDGTEISPAVIDPRCHANLRLIDESLAEHIPEDLQLSLPNPRRTWA